MNETKTTENWTEKQLQYIQFLGRGKRDKLGDKYTNEEFAKSIGVDPWTLYSWKKLPGFKQTVFDDILNNNIDKLPELMEAQLAAGTHKGKGGDTAAALFVMRQFELLRADKLDQNTQLSGAVNFGNQVPIEQ